jgi:hypothetical protein
MLDRSQEPDFQRHISGIFFVYSELRWDMIARFANIGGIVCPSSIYGFWLLLFLTSLFKFRFIIYHFENFTKDY